MTAAATIRELSVREIPTGNLDANPWNPNRLSPAMRHKLKVYIKREGLVEPLVVRPKADGRFEILGGYHRWLIAQELGYTTVPCSVVEQLDDRRAKILSINLNEMKGESVPALLARVIHDLELELSLDDLETQLPYTLPELKDLDKLLQIPDGLEAQLDEEIAKAEKERPIVLSFVVDDSGPVENALARAAVLGPGRMTRGQALLHICRAYLDLSATTTDHAAPQGVTPNA
jgi:ParB-like chromosome segregation protein Spo0J